MRMGFGYIEPIRMSAVFHWYPADPVTWMRMRVGTATGRGKVNRAKRFPSGSDLGREDLNLRLQTDLLGTEHVFAC